MRVLWMIDSLGPGGAESLMLPLLKNIKHHGIEARVCVLNVRANNPFAAELRKIGIEVDLVQVHNLRNITTFWELFNYIRHFHPDIIHTQLETSDIFGTLAAKLLGIPSISTIHTLEVPSKRIKKYWRNLLRWNFLKYFSRQVIVVSEFTRQHYVGLGFRGEKLITLYNGIDLKKFQGNDEYRSSKVEVFGLPADSTIITTVAVLRELKGIQHMINAFPGLLDKIPNLYYVIVGSGDYQGHLENLSKSLGIFDRVVFMNYRADIPTILAASDLFVYPTLKDALPTALLEAMAAGVPVVASQIGGVPEIIENDVTGLLVPPSCPSSLADACLQLLCNHDYARRLVMTAQETVRRSFDIHQQVNSLMTVYKQNLKGQGSLRFQ